MDNWVIFNHSSSSRMLDDQQPISKKILTTGKVEFNRFITARMLLGGNCQRNLGRADGGRVQMETKMSSLNDNKKPTNWWGLAKRCATQLNNIGGRSVKFNVSLFW